MFYSIFHFSILACCDDVEQSDFQHLVSREWTFVRENEKWIYSAGPEKPRDLPGDLPWDFPGDLPRNFPGDFLTEVSDRALDIRIADFKGCVLLPLLLLLFE